MYYELMADIILGIMVITLILGMLSIIPMAIPVGININRRFIIWNRYFYNKRKWRIDLEH